MGFENAQASFQADGRVYSSGDGGIVEPARRDGLRLRVELHRLLAVGTEIAELGAARSREAEKRHRHGNGHVDADLADVDLRLELPGRGTALGKNARTVAEG